MKWCQRNQLLSRKIYINETDELKIFTVSDYITECISIKGIKKNVRYFKNKGYQLNQ